MSKQPAPDATSQEKLSSDEPLRFKFLQLQVTYFMTQMTIADAKCAVIVAFLIAVSGVTADKVHLGRGVPLTDVDWIGIVALLLSAISCVFAFSTVWPRRISDSPVAYINLFSWVSVSKMAAAKSGSYYPLLHAASDEEMARHIAYTMEDLASIVARKYVAIRRTFIVLAPATIAHVVYWLLR